MALIWDAKNNFILSHSINFHQQQLLTSNIDWPSIVNDIQLEISSTPILLQNQYEYLLKIFHPKNDSKLLYSTLKHIYLHSLCQQIEDDSKSILEIVYEFVRHMRAKRINENDIEQLIKEWNFNYVSDKQKENKERLFNILTRLHDYNGSNSLHYHFHEYSNTNQSAAAVTKEINEEELEIILETNVENLMTNKQDQLILNINEQDKSSLISRRRTKSLSIAIENQDNKVNIGVEWFVPKFKRQQRSSSLHSRSQSPIPIVYLSSQNQNLSTDIILMTTVDKSNSIDNSNLRQTKTEPPISWLPLTDEQILEKDLQQTKSKLFNMQDLEQVSSTDSDSIEIQWQTSTTNKTARSPSSHGLYQQEHTSCKRQRLSEDN